MQNSLEHDEVPHLILFYSFTPEQLGMRNTCFRPIDKTDFNPLVVPTEVDRMHRNRLLWGEGRRLRNDFLLYLKL